MSDEFKNGTCAPSDCASCGLDCGGTLLRNSHNTITLTLDDDTESRMCNSDRIFQVEEAGIHCARCRWTKMARIRVERYIFINSPVQRTGDPILANIEE